MTTAEVGADLAGLLREAMSYRATGLAVITARGPAGADLALTASSLCCASLDPPLVVVGVRRTSPVRAGLAAGATWAATLLAEDQRALAACFARPRAQHRPDDFGRWDTHRMPGGSLVFAHALAALECTTTTTFDAGTTTLAIGTVTAAVPGPATRPLLYYRRDYHHLP
jgi:flavin reductase (DIM6/NTAB) family NADH-FMN oxidoreductase RutF